MRGGSRGLVELMVTVPAKYHNMSVSKEYLSKEGCVLEVGETTAIVKLR